VGGREETRSPEASAALGSLSEGTLWGSVAVSGGTAPEGGTDTLTGAAPPVAGCSEGPGAAGVPAEGFTSAEGDGLAVSTGATAVLGREFSFPLTGSASFSLGWLTGTTRAEGFFAGTGSETDEGTGL